MAKQGRVIVTGASRGIGRALCEELAGRGYALVLAARSEDQMRPFAAELTERYGVACEVIGCDLVEEAGRADLVKRALEGGEVLGLVNNAGFGTSGPFTTIDAAEERRMIRLNVEALVDLCHAFAPHLGGEGSFIMNVASTAGFQPVPLFATYAATKAFVLSFSQALAEELADAGIHVMALAPGITETGFQATANLDKPKGMATAEEVARYGVKALEKRRRVAVHGAMNGLMAFSTRFSPAGMTMKIARRVMASQGAGKGH